MVLLFCGLKEKDKLQNEILNSKKTLILKKHQQTNRTANNVTNNEYTLAHIHKLSHKVI